MKDILCEVTFSLSKNHYVWIEVERNAFDRVNKPKVLNKGFNQN